MAQTDSLSALKQLIDMLHRSMAHGSKPQRSRGASQLSALANYRGDHYEATERISFGIKDGNLDQLDELTQIIETTKAEIRAAEAISARFATERDDVKSQIDEKMSPFFNTVFKDPEFAKAQFELICESENPQELMAEFVQARIDVDSEFRKRMDKNEPGSPMRAYRKVLDDVKADLTRKGVDIKDGGQRIFAREMMARVPEVFGSKAGSKGLLENAQRKAANNALKDFDPAEPELLDLEEKLGLATHKADLSVRQVERIYENVQLLEQQQKEMNDRADLKQLEALATGLEARAAAGRAELGGNAEEAELEEPQAAEPEADAPDQAELDFGENEPEVEQEEPELAAAAAAAAEPEVPEPDVEEQQVAAPVRQQNADLDSVYDVEGPIMGAPIDYTDDKIATNHIFDIKLDPEDRIGAPAEPKGPSLMEKISNGIADRANGLVNRFHATREQMNQFASNMKANVAREYAEVTGNMKGRLLALSASPQLVVRQRIEPTLDYSDDAPNVEVLDKVPTVDLDMPLEATAAAPTADTPQAEEYYYEPPAVNHDRIMEMRAVYNTDDLDLEGGERTEPRSAYFRAQVDREAEKFRQSPNGTAVPYKHADGRSEVIPAHLTPVYREVEQMEHFEATGEYVEKQPADLKKAPEQPKPHKERAAERMARRRAKRPTQGGIRVGWGPKF